MPPHHSQLRTRSLVVRNASELPLLYRLRTSGSVDSAGIRFHDARVGVVRPYGWREVVFTLRPCLSGTFQEQVRAGL